MALFESRVAPLHALKAFWYYCILYGPAFVAGPMPIVSFALYMALMGICGVLDHRYVSQGLAATLVMLSLEG